MKSAYKLIIIECFYKTPEFHVYYVSSIICNSIIYKIKHLESNELRAMIGDMEYFMNSDVVYYLINDIYVVLL